MARRYAWPAAQVPAPHRDHPRAARSAGRAEPKAMARLSLARAYVDREARRDGDQRGHRTPELRGREVSERDCQRRERHAQSRISRTRGQRCNGLQNEGEWKSNNKAAAAGLRKNCQMRGRWYAHSGGSASAKPPMPLKFSVGPSFGRRARRLQARKRRASARRQAGEHPGQSETCPRALRFDEFGLHGAIRKLKWHWPKPPVLAPSAGKAHHCSFSGKAPEFPKLIRKWREPHRLADFARNGVSKWGSVPLLTKY